MGVPVADIARMRSYEAELATEAVADEPDHLTNAHAAQLHTEAAAWHRRSQHARRAARHESYATVHSRLAARLQPDEEDL